MCLFGEKVKAESEEEELRRGAKNRIKRSRADNKEERENNKMTKENQ